MNPRSIILILLAVLFAGGTVYMANNWLSSQRALMAKKEPVIEKPEQFVLVAKVNLPTGTLLRADHLRWQAWPEAGLAKSYVRRTAKSNGKAQIASFVGAVVRKGVTLGEPITAGRVVKPGERGFLAAVLHPEMRAISVSVSATTAAAGFIFPGDRIDLILTHKVRRKRRVSETVLTNVRVLAVDQKTNDQNKRASLAKTMTLEVTPKQVEMINVARSIGRLSLSLRALPRVGEEAVARANRKTTGVAANQPGGSRTTMGVATNNAAGDGVGGKGGQTTASASKENDVIIQVESLEEQYIPGRGKSVTGVGEVSRALGSGPTVTIVRGRVVSRTAVKPNKKKSTVRVPGGGAAENSGASEEGEEAAE